MNMPLDARQRAMLQEMGVRLWWPTQSAAAVDLQPTIPKSDRLLGSSKSPQIAVGGSQSLVDNERSLLAMSAYRLFACQSVGQCTPKTLWRGLGPAQARPQGQPASDRPCVLAQRPGPAQTKRALSLDLSCA